MDSSVITPNISLPLESIVQVTFLFTLLVVIVFSIILYYHWEQYAINKKVKDLTYLAYAIVIVSLIGIMAILTFII